MSFRVALTYYQHGHGGLPVPIRSPMSILVFLGIPLVMHQCILLQIQPMQNHSREAPGILVMNRFPPQMDGHLDRGCHPPAISGVIKGPLCQCRETGLDLG